MSLAAVRTRIGGRSGVSAEWLRATRPGLIVMAVLVGVAAALGAVAFRWLINAFTWLFTGRITFGQQGHAASLHLPFLGPWFVLVIPVVAGLVYGPLIQTFAREARGHGVPEVMVAVAENGGRIRPQVTVVKALASALCIASGGSVGREGPIVQIGSALASTFGQSIRMSENRLRLLVACGAAGAISATFNAPLTGVFFGLELILGEISLDGFIGVLVASMTADAIGEIFFGRGPFLAGLPQIHFPHPADYLLVAVLGLIAGAVGILFKTVLYRVEDLCDAAWRGRPEWLRPALGGLLLGLVLLAVPEMYGVGYPVMDLAIAGRYAFWFVLLLCVAKMLTASLTIGIGGSGGVFAPSLFTGACLGAAYGMLVNHLLGPAAGPVPVYAMVAMGAVFAGATRAPLTATAGVLEMTGNFGIVLPVMLCTALAAAVSARLSRGTIYTTKLLRRGIDIERPKPSSLMQVMTVGEAMVPVPRRDPLGDLGELTADGSSSSPPVASGGPPQSLFDNETLEQALRQLVLYGHDGLPVLAEDGQTVVGWIRNRDVMRAFARRLGQTASAAEEGARAAEFASNAVDEVVHRPPAPLEGYRLVTLGLPSRAPSSFRLSDVDWPHGSLVVAVRRGARSFTPGGASELREGDVLTVLTPEEAVPVLQATVEGLAVPGPELDPRTDETT